MVLIISRSIDLTMHGYISSILPIDSVPPDLLQSELVLEQQHGPPVGILDGHRVEHPTSRFYRRPATNNPS